MRSKVFSRVNVLWHWLTVSPMLCTDWTTFDKLWAVLIITSYKTNYNRIWNKQVRDGSGAYVISGTGGKNYLNQTRRFRGTWLLSSYSWQPCYKKKNSSARDNRINRWKLQRNWFDSIMTNLDGILKSRDITLPTKVCLVKAMVFPGVMHGCESWTIKKTEHWRMMLLNCGVGEDSWESLGLQGDPTSPS